VDILSPLLLIAACAPSSRPPGLLVIVTDTTRQDLGGATPPAAASRGRRYTNAWGAASYTTASTVTLVSGRWPMGDERDVPVPDMATSGHRLTRARWPQDSWVEAGGGTVLTDQPIVKILREEDLRGDWYQHPGSPALFNQARAWVHNQDQPWVLYLHATAAHSPYDGFIGPGAARRSDHRKSTAALRFDAAVQQFQVDRSPVPPDLLAWARWQYRTAVESTALGIDDLLSIVSPDSTVIWTADHGESLGEDELWGHGSGLNDAQVRVPLVVWGPGVRAVDDPTPVPATCVGQTARLVLGLASDGCDLRSGKIVGTPVVGKLAGDAHARTGSGIRAWVTRTWGQPWDPALDPDQP